LRKKENFFFFLRQKERSNPLRTNGVLSQVKM
jgi:hypothetical protein